MDFLKRAGEYFTNHVSVHTFHFTSDGMAFQGKNDAEAHARTLTNKEVKTIVRADVEVADEVVSDEDPEALKDDTSTYFDSAQQPSLSEPEPEPEPEPEVEAETLPETNTSEREAKKPTTKAKAAKK